MSDMNENSDRVEDTPEEQIEEEQPIEEPTDVSEPSEDITQPEIVEGNVDGPEKTSGESPPSADSGEPSGEITVTSQDTSDKESGQVTLGAIQADTVNIIGQQNIYNIYKGAADADKWSLFELHDDTWRRVEMVFVPSRDYENCRSSGIFNTEEHRVFIVYGPKNSGRFTTAVHLGLELWGKGRNTGPQFQLYNRTARETRSLIEFVQYSELPDNTIFILENAFESGVSLGDLSSHYLDIMNHELGSKDSYLILTAAEDHLLDSLQLSKVNAVIEDRHQVFEKHLDLYSGSGFELVPVAQALIERARQYRDQLVPNFKYPFQVNLFCQKLGQLALGASDEDLQELARQIARIGQEPTLWFRNLPNNAKFYAMLVFLFSGVNCNDLNEIYTLAVRELRNDGIADSFLRDPREFGLDDMLEMIHAHKEAYVVRFEIQALAQEVSRQIGNYHHLLWSSLIYRPTDTGVVLKLIELFKAPEHWELRRDLGAAIGRLGIYHISKLRGVLELLAHHPSKGVVAVAGYALDEICRNSSSSEQTYKYVTGLIQQWVESGDPDLMWAAGASIWRVYDGLVEKAQADGDGNREARLAQTALEQIQESITNLGETFDKFNGRALKKLLLDALESAHIQDRPEPQSLIDQAILSIEVKQEVGDHIKQQLTDWAAGNLSSILHAIRQIAKTNPRDVVRKITEWLQAEDESNLRILGQIAGHQLFEENAYPDIQLFDERHIPLLDLVGPLLSTDTNIVNTMLATLLVWLGKEGWADRVYKALLYVVNRATPEERAILRAGLSELWLDDDTEDARRIGQSLIARSYIMDGVPVDMPGNYYGVIALDASYEANINKVGATAGYKLYARLNSQIDIQIVRMGATGVLAQSGESISTSDLQAGHAHPRLLVPQLEDLNPDKVYFVLVLALEQIVDLDDLFDGLWIKRLIVATAKQQAAYPDQLDTIAVDSLLSEERSLPAVEIAVQKRLAQTLARRKPDEWEVNLRDYLERDYHNVDAVMERLDNWIAQLDDIDHATHSKDVARLIACAVLWLASQDLAHCVSIVRKWLTSDTQVEHTNSPVDKDNVEEICVDGERESNELYCLMGQACGKALFNLYAYATPIPSVETHAVLLELAPELAKRSWSGAEAVLHAVRRWAVQPEWAERLLTRPNGSVSELIELVDAVLPENQEALTRILQDWTKPLDAEDKESVSDPIKKLTEQLQLRVALGTRAPLPVLPEGHTYGLVVIDASGRNQRTRRQLAKLASKVIKRLTKAQETLHLLTYRMGQDFPVAVPGEIPDADALIPAGLGRRPRLLSPLLEMHSIEQVRFVLLLANSPVLDVEDWRNTHWNERVVVYSEASQSLWAEGLTLLAKQSGVEDAQQVIVNYLTTKIGV